MRLQDKGNSMVIVDKETDLQKAEEQIQRSSFIRIKDHPTGKHFNNVREWTNKWHAKGHISTRWKEYIINVEATPGKNDTLYKTGNITCSSINYRMQHGD